MIKLFSLLLMMILSGCSLGPVKVKPVDYYTLDPINVPRSYSKRGVLAIDVPRAVHGLQTNSMLYSEREFQINEYAYSKWTSNPANLLQELLLESFNRAGLFKAVIGNSFAKSADWCLNIRILQWHQNFLETPSEIMVSYIANVYDLKRQKIIASKVFETIITCPSENAYGGVIAMNNAMNELVPKTINFVKIYTR